MTERVTVKAECNACGATGVYRGYAEPPGVGVVCNRCKGTGCIEQWYVPFTQRKRCAGVQRVHHSMGCSHSVGYEEFLSGNMPRSN